MASVPAAAVTVGIRPEHIGLGPPSSAAEIGARGTCDLVEYLGPQLLVHLRVGEDELVVLDDPADEVVAGDTLECHISPERVHLFDTASGRVLTG